MQRFKPANKIVKKIGNRFIPNYAIDCSAFTINNGCANVRQWLRQAYSPPNGDIAFSPTLRFRSALGWIISPFQGCFSMVNCQWLFVGYMIRRVPRITINHCPKGLKARIISAPSRKGGVSTSGPCSEGWRPEWNSFLFLPSRNLGLSDHDGSLVVQMPSEKVVGWHS